jgi:hydrogenase maturation protease
MRLFIGIGNPLRGCDRFGLEIVEYLSEYETISLHQLTPEDILLLQKCDEVIFFDASYGDTHGAIACSIDKSSSTLTHKLSIHDFMTLANEYYGKSIEYSIYSIICSEFEYKDSIDSDIKSSIEYIFRYLKAYTL